MKFRAIIDQKNRRRTPAPSGDKITIVKGWKYIDGEFVYCEKKKHPHYEETQAAKDSVDLKKMIERYNAGDDSALDRVNGFFLDTVNLPRTLGDLYDSWSNAQTVFDAMPAEIKEKYGNNPAKFYKEYGSAGFDKFMNDYRASLGSSEMNIDTAKVGENNESESE